MLALPINRLGHKTADSRGPGTGLGAGAFIRLRTASSPAQGGKLKEFVGFARGNSEDYEAGRSALTYEWSNGQLEGQVNRLKLIK